LSMIGAPEKNRVRGRIHALLIGPPGLGKTKLSREAIKVRRNSRYVSAKNTTGRSLTAMILKEGDNYVLNLGPVPLAKNELCVVNEFDKMHSEEQDNLLDVMEEGEITVNKYAKLHTIKSPTTIIATANPRNNRWKDSDNIRLDEIPLESVILSRFDLVLIFRDITDEHASRDFANSKTSYDERHIQHNYNFLEKFIEYVRTIDPGITEEAKSMLNEFWIRLKKKQPVAITNRTLESIHRIAKAFARLHLCDLVDTKIASEAIGFMDKMFQKFYACIDYIPEPRALAYDEVIKVIQQQKAPIDLVEAVKMVCRGNEQIKYYLGNNLEQSRNKKLRELCNTILENGNIQRINSNPIVVRFVTDTTQIEAQPNTTNKNQHDLNDLNDLTSREYQTKNEENSDGKAAIETSSNENSRSQGSQGSRGLTQTPSIVHTKESLAELPPIHDYPISSSMITPLSNSADDSLLSVVADPTCQNNGNKSSKDPKIRYTDDGRHDGVFWRIYDELENSSLNRDKTVSGQELKARLISSNKFFVGDAVLIIERMVRTGKLAGVAFDTYRRKGENSS
jgi:MoxR-like ATPase